MYLRWRFQDFPVSEDESDEDPHTELVKVMWCHGVTYRCAGIQS